MAGQSQRIRGLCARPYAAGLRSRRRELRRSPATVVGKGLNAVPPSRRAGGLFAFDWGPKSVWNRFGSASHSAGSLVEAITRHLFSAVELLLPTVSSGRLKALESAIVDTAAFHGSITDGQPKV